MRIAVDASFVDPGRVGGAEQMVAGLVRGLAESAQPDDAIDVFTDLPWALPGAVRFRKPGGRGNRFTRIATTLRPLLQEYDAVLFTNYYTPPLPRRRRRPRFVTVIHDLQYAHFAEFFTARKRVWLRLAHEVTLRAADATVAISEVVRRDILDTYGARWASRVRTIHNPVDWDRLEPVGEPGPPPVEGRYVLAVAAHSRHKNLETVIRAFGELRRRGRHDDVSLVLVGQLGANLRGVGTYSPLAETIAAEQVGEAVHVTGYVDDRALGDAYRHATVAVSLSLFEGFALTPVEAIGLGLPVLAARGGVVSETTRGLATHVDDPRDVDAVTGLLGEMLDDPDAFRPAREGVDRLRAAYAPATIGARYRELLAELAAS
jgi:glycosyltransferase involved in cell wall biosynthesis